MVQDDGFESEKKRVLIVSGDMGEVLQLKELLSLYAQDMELDIAEDGLSAFRKLIRTRFDLILLDFFLPDADGEAVLDKVKELRPGLPVIIMAGKGAEQFAAHMLRLGASDYVLKGTNFHSDMLHALKRNLERLEQEKRVTLLEGVMARMPVGALVIDAMGTIVLANTKAKGIIGDVDLEGNPVKETLPDGDVIAKACTKALTGEVVQLDSGSVQPIELYGSPFWAVVFLKDQ